MADAKERLMHKGEYLVREFMHVNYIYFLLAGSLKIEKEVVVTSTNKWPGEGSQTHIHEVKDRVLFHIRDVTAPTILFENECMLNRGIPIQVVAAQNETRVLMLPRAAFKRCMAEKEIQEMLKCCT
jgi:CRP-like cAMP-binding protein